MGAFNTVFHGVNVCRPAKKREGDGVVAVVSVAGGRDAIAVADDVDVDEPNALCFSVVRQRRSLLRGVESQRCPLVVATQIETESKV